MGEREAKPQGSRPWLSWAILLVLLLLALILRWRYIREISLFVDEFVTAWAARNILSHGLPIFPSGNVYPHGLVFTYLEVPFVLGRFDEALVRVPGLLVSLLGLPVVYWVGRRFFSTPVGLIAAAAMAVDPDCIVWGGRARMYGLLQLLTLLVIYVYYRGLVEDRPRDRYLAMGLFVFAVFTHAEATFLLPILGLATLVVFPWRRVFRWSVVFPFLLGGAGALLFYLTAMFGQPGHLETLQESRPYLNLSAGFLSGPQVFAPFFTSLYRLPFTLLGIVGLYFLVRPRFGRKSPLTYLYVVFGAFVILIVFLAGATWQRERYLFMVLPLFFLIGAQVLIHLLSLVPALRQPQPWRDALLALLVALYVGLTGARTAFVQEWGYDLAFRHLRDQLQPEAADRIVTSMSTASMLYLGRNDAFAIQQGYEEYVVADPKRGVPVDLWTATPMLTSTVAFSDLLAAGSTVWFVTDGWRFQTRYEPDFVLTVLEQMDLEHEERGVLVFRSEGYQSLPEPVIQRQRQADFDKALALVGFGLSPAEASPGDNLEVTLYWQALGEAGPAYTAFLHLLAPDGTPVAGVDEPVLRGLYQPDLWTEGDAIPDRHHLPLPADLVAGRYRLDLGLYPTDQPGELLPVAGGDRLPLAAVTVGEMAAPTPSMPADVSFGDQIRLLGYDLERFPDYDVGVTLYWEAIGEMDRDYTVFVHLVGPEGDIVDQDDAPPGDPFFPTSTWLPGETVRDDHALHLPEDSPLGDFSLLVGVYYRPTDERLRAMDASGAPLGNALPLPLPGVDGYGP